MLKNIKELYSLLDREQRKKLLILQLLVVLMSLAEVASVLAIGPFMALVGDISQLQGEGIIAGIFKKSGMENTTDFLVVTAISVLAVLTVAALISMFTIWRLTMYGFKVGGELSSRLFHYYMNQSWLFHAGGNSSELTNKISQESQRITGGIIAPLMQMNARLVTAFMIALTIFIYNPWVAVFGILMFSTAYISLYRVVRRQLTRNGETVTREQALRFKLMGEGFGGIKDTLLLGRQGIFTQRFTKASERFSHSLGRSQVLSQVPRYAIELIAFSAVILLVIYLLIAHEGNVGTILPILSVYALAGFKLLPAFQQVYSSVSLVKGNLSAFESLRDDLKNSTKTINSIHTVEKEDSEHTLFKSHLVFKDVVFKYPSAMRPALNDFDMSIPANKVIGLVGSSGSGKSTAIDVLLGLVEPTSGQVLIDGVPLSDIELRAWQNNLGFVPQSIFLADASIRENIAFGLPLEGIDEEKIRRSANMAHLDELLQTLPKGLDTKVGERGVQLSGGQRQRIGIARALYHDANVLILDEATSALDGITEKLIMDAIHDFSGKKTIIMIAHRLATVKQCDCIYMLDKGKVIDSGSYEELLVRNPTFKRMAEHA